MAQIDFLVAHVRAQTKIPR